MNRCKGNIEGAALEQAFHQGAEPFGAAVVKIGFKNRDMILFQVRRSCLPSENSAQKVGLLGNIAAADSVTGFFNGHVRKRTEGR